MLLCNLHCVKHAFLVTAHKVLDVGADGHALIFCQGSDDLLHPFGYRQFDPVIVRCLVPVLISGIHILFIASSFAGSSTWV